MRTRRQRYSAEFKREALKRANEDGMIYFGSSDGYLYAVSLQ